MRSLLTKIEGIFIGLLIATVGIESLYIAGKMEDEKSANKRTTPYENYLKTYREAEKKRGPIGFCVNR